MIDRLGRTVELTEASWTHICEGHPELADRRDEVKEAVASAEIRCRGRFAGHEVLYGDEVGPARWLAVVVAYEADEGQVITAYATTRGPKGKERL